VWDRFRGKVGPFSRDFHAGYAGMVLSPRGDIVVLFLCILFPYLWNFSSSEPDLKLINARVQSTCEPALDSTKDQVTPYCHRMLINILEKMGAKISRRHQYEAKLKSRIIKAQAPRSPFRYVGFKANLAFHSFQLKRCSGHCCYSAICSYKATFSILIGRVVSQW